MTISTRVTIDASPDAVWPFVADPILETTWNPKIIAVERDAEGPVRTGERFAIDFAMSDAPTECEAEVVRSEAPRVLEYRYHIREAKKPTSLLVRYELSPGAQATTLVQTIDLSDMRINPVLRSLIWFFTRSGKTVGMPYMEELKRQVEAFEDS